MMIKPLDNSTYFASLPIVDTGILEEVAILPSPTQCILNCAMFIYTPVYSRLGDIYNGDLFGLGGQSAVVGRELSHSIAHPYALIITSSPICYCF